MSFYLKQLQVGPMENFIYLIGDTKTRECVMVDPAWNVNAVIEEAKKDDMKVVGALATHYHADHTNGVGDLLTLKGLPVYINKHDAPYLRGLQSELTKIDAGHELQIGEIKITCIHTPGHTPGSQCFMVNNNLISGDTLFIGACGRCDLPGGNAEQMYHSLQKISKLGDDVVLFPGHNYSENPTSTLGIEKRTNPYYQVSSLQEFLTERMG